MPPPAAPNVHQSAHGGSQYAPPAQAEPPAGISASSMNNAQAAGARAQQPERMHVRGADLAHDHIEAFNDRHCDMRVREVMELTAKHQPNYVDPSEDELDRVLKESLRMYDEHQMENFAKEREHIQAAVMGNLSQGGGGPNRGAGGAAPRAKRNSPANSMKSMKDSAGNVSPGNDPPGPSRVSFAPSKREQSQTPFVDNVLDGETADTAHNQQPAAPDVNLERSRSPTRSPSRARRHHRRRDAEWERWSSRPRGDAERWRRAGMYYSSGAYKGDILDNARVRHRRRSSQP